jgi:tetratricopeptide (TPR) repeat protein
MSRPAFLVATTNLAVLAFTAALGAAVLLALLTTQQRLSGAADHRLSAEADPRPRTDRMIEGLQNRLRHQPQHAETSAWLGQLYLRKARESGDLAYYPRAEAALRQALDLDPGNASALIGLGSLALARHRFHEALEWGQRVQPLAPFTPAVYGLLADAQTELGQYPEALASVQRMVDLRPDLSAYSRVAYARELHGDLEGAVAAMTMAVEAGAPGQESTAWARVQLGHLHLTRGALEHAEHQYRVALADVRDYPHALAGLGRVAAARGDHAAAIDAFTRATTNVPIPEYLVALADLYQATGQTHAMSAAHELIGAMQRLQSANGMDIDLELAMFDLDHDRDIDGAAARLQALRALQPSIRVDDALGWALFKTGQCAEARRVLQRALRLGTQDPLMFFHAGMAEACLGNHAAAETWLQRALDLNPGFSILHAERARQALTEARTARLAAGERNAS